MTLCVTSVRFCGGKFGPKIGENRPKKAFLIY